MCKKSECIRMMSERRLRSLVHEELKNLIPGSKIFKEMMLKDAKHLQNSLKNADDALYVRIHANSGKVVIASLENLLTVKDEESIDLKKKVIKSSKISS